MFPFIFLLSLHRIWFRSLMDRMKDSGSFDWGSSPHGITDCNAMYLKLIHCVFIKNYFENRIRLLK